MHAKDGKGDRKPNRTDRTVGWIWGKVASPEGRGKKVGLGSRRKERGLAFCVLYHVAACGDVREDIDRGDADRLRTLDSVGVRGGGGRSGCATRTLRWGKVKANPHPGSSLDIRCFWGLMVSWNR